jgi:AraC family transcriptional regulator
MPDTMPTFCAVSPPSVDRRQFHWGDGRFETARRPFTSAVEGRLSPKEPVVMVTLRGGAEHHELSVDDGYRYSGPDIAGSISFLPAGCTRELQLRNVAWHWASITLPQAALSVVGGSGVRPFSAAYDPFVLSMLAEVDRLHATDRHLDAVYCDAMALALVQYLAARYWEARPAANRSKPDLLPTWRLRRLRDYMEGHLGDEIRIAQLAEIAGISEGHFYRAFRATTGQTPLGYINDLRIEAAKRLLATDAGSINTVGPRVGFVSQSHFSRIFQARTGVTPRIYRRQFRSE